KRRRDPERQHQFGDAVTPPVQIADRERHPAPGIEPDETVAQQRAEPGNKRHPAENAADDHLPSITDQRAGADVLLFRRPAGAVTASRCDRHKSTKPSNAGPAHFPGLIGLVKVERGWSIRRREKIVAGAAETFDFIVTGAGS